MTALLLGMVTAAIEEIQTQILTIETRTDAERYYKSEALKLSPSISPRSSTRSTRVTS